LRCSAMHRASCAVRNGHRSGGFAGPPPSGMRALAARSSSPELLSGVEVRRLSSHLHRARCAPRIRRRGCFQLLLVVPAMSGMAVQRGNRSPARQVDRTPANKEILRCSGPRGS